MCLRPLASFLARVNRRGPAGLSRRAGQLVQATVGHCFRFPRRAACWLLFATTCLLAGCGADVYEQRLANTSRMFQFMEVLDNHLTAPWRESGISLRVPKQFTLIPPPPLAAASEGEDAAPPEEIHDERQPEFLRAPLPGLEAAFRCDLILDSPDQQTQPGFIYVLSNLNLPEDPPDADAPADGEPKASKTAKFYRDFVRQLAGELHIQINEAAMDELKPDAVVAVTPSAGSGWDDEKYPTTSENFVTPVPYRILTMIPRETINGAITNFEVHLYEKGEIQVIVLVVFPQGVHPGEKLSESLALALGTLSVTGDKIPTGGTRDAGGAPAPSGSSF